MMSFNHILLIIPQIPFFGDIFGMHPNVVCKDHFIKCPSVFKLKSMRRFYATKVCICAYFYSLPHNVITNVAQVLLFVSSG